MTNFGAHLEEYLRLRRALGHELADAARLLPRFVAYLDTIGASAITVENALAWVTEPQAGPGSVVWLHRMGAVRGFARHMSGIDPANEIPPLGLVSFKRSWHQPYIYSEIDILALMDEVSVLIPTPFRAATFRTMIGLLAATGMRVSEVIALSRSDIDWADGVLTVRHSKFDKSREVPLDASTVQALRGYSDMSDQYVPAPTSNNFFVSGKGAPVIYPVFGEMFRRLVDRAGVGEGAPRRPRIHDMRHSFAVSTLVRWQREGQDIGELLPRLSTYLGHLSPSYTYWYLSAAPELLALAAAHLEKRCHS